LSEKTAIINVLYKRYLDAVTLTGSSEYAVPGTVFTLTCDVPEEANFVQFYRRPDVTSVGGIQPAGGTTQTGDQGSVWFCSRTNLNLPNQDLNSGDYTLNLADGPGTSISLSPPDTTYIRTEGDILPDITCTADCRPGCIIVWTRPDNTNFTVSPVLSLGQLDRSEHGTYRCTARNVAGESTISMSVTVQYGPGTSIALSPTNLIHTRTEGDTLPDITCTADCRPDCTFVWTRPDNTNFSVSPVLSLGQLDRSEHGTYRCTARNEVGESTISIIITVICEYYKTIINFSVMCLL
ncbi:peroxidasin homolog, partial [Argopecten irradians]|uniref:peroxidasin homolog n=1 Tax=Argopecten irradians TaxID=31199 RepID=UPI00371F56D8